jgi:BASS family bile acid:Na+ symporter
MSFFIKILRNRNAILILAVVGGLLVGDWAHKLKDLTIYFLILVMTFSMTHIRSSSLSNMRSMLRPMLMGALLNYVVFGGILILLARLFVSDRDIYYGLVVIATTPPGVAIIPFSYILKGNIEYAIKGVLGAFLAAVFISPFVINWLTGNETVESMDLFVLLLKTIALPLFLSRFLLYESLFHYIEKMRGRIVDWGFALLIFIAVGLNRHVFFGDPLILGQVSLVLFLALFVVGELFGYIGGRLFSSQELLISQKLLLTVKSSGFSVVTALSLFGQKAAIPTAILAVFVLLYLLYLAMKSG